MRSTLALLAAWLLFAAAPSYAWETSSWSEMGPTRSQWHLGVGGGTSMPLTNAGDRLEDGYNGLVYLGWSPIDSPWGLRFSADVNRHDLRGSIDPEATATVIGGMGGITVGAPFGTVRPYLTTSAGAFQIATKVNGERTETVKFGIEAGVGMQLKLGGDGGVALFAEGRLQHLFNPPRAATSLTELDHMETVIVPITFGIHF